MTTLGQKVALNATALALGRVLQTAIGVIAVGASARYLGLAEFGALVTATAYSAVLGALSEVGLFTIGVRELAKRPDESKRIIGSLLTLSFVISLMGLALGLLVMLMIYGGDENSRVREGITVLLLMSWPLTAPATVVGCYFTAQQKAYLGIIASVVGSVISIALLVTVILAGGGFLGIVVAYGAASMGYGATMLVLSIGRVRLRPSLDLPHAWQLLRWALPLGAATFLLGIYWKIDIILLSRLGTSSDVALYGVAYKIIDAVLVLPGYVMVTLLPEFARLADQREALARIMQKAIGVMQVAGTPILVLCIVFADEIVRTIGGGDYGESAALLRILMAGVALAYLATVLGQGIVALNLQNRLLYVSVGVLAVNVASCVALIPLLGPRGAAIAYVAAEAVGLVVLLAIYGKFATPPRLERLPAFLVAAGAMAAAAGLVKLLPFVASNAPLVLALGGLVGMCVYVGCLYALKAMPREIHTTLVLPIWTRLRPR